MHFAPLLFFASCALAETLPETADNTKYTVSKSNLYNVCSAVYLGKTAAYFSQKEKGVAPPVYEDEVRKVNEALKTNTGQLPVFATESDIRRPEWIQAFSLYCGYTYCGSQSKVSKMSEPLKGLTNPLPTGNFKVLDWAEHEGYVGATRLPNQQDGFFYTAVNEDQKLIVLTWRGSHKANDFIADADRELIGFQDLRSHIFADNTTQSSACTVPSDTADTFFFGGFIKTIQSHVLERVVESLTKAKSAYPNFSIVINGHSLGGAKAVLTATYLAKYYSNNLPLAAVYTFGQPIVGSTKAGEWMAKCIGPEKMVRVTASNDLVPWMGFAENVQHPSSVIEVYNANSYANEWRRCEGGVDRTCSFGVRCALKSWLHHSMYSGFRMGIKLCSSQPDALAVA
jgi:hypothetical protein